MTLTLSPEIENALIEESVRQGTTPEELVIEALRVKFPVLKETPEDFRARVHALNGSMAHLGPGRILEERAVDRMREERHWSK